MNPKNQQTREQFIDDLFLLKKEDNFLLEEEAVKKVIDGVKKGYNAIKVSYGSAGSNATIKSPLYPYHESTNDGKKILDSLKPQDEYETIGLNTLREVADKSDKLSGDARKTAAILYSAILFESQKYKENPIKISQSIKKCLPLIIESLDKQSREISPGEVDSIAATASESEELGNTFKDIYEEIGREGIIEIDNSGLPTTHFEITEGVRLRGAGMMYPYMANDEKGRSSEYKDPSVLVVKQKISNYSEIDPIIKYLVKEGKGELVIFCDEIDLSVSQALAFLHNQGIQKDGQPFTFQTLVIKSPTLWKDLVFEDFSKITGATIINPANGSSLKNFHPKYLGNCGKIISNKEETIVLGIKDISEHLKTLKENGDDDSKRRIFWLKTKTAVLKLGANSEYELSKIRGKALDARNSSYLALNGGVVTGGGVALLNASTALPDTVGGNILRESLKYPIKQIIENAGADIDISSFNDGEGFDAKNDRVVNMQIMGILDASTAVKNAVINAISVASTQITTRLLVK